MALHGTSDRKEAGIGGVQHERIDSGMQYDGAVWSEEEAVSCGRMAAVSRGDTRMSSVLHEF